jgi:hypothetical protein
VVPAAAAQVLAAAHAPRHLLLLPLPPLAAASAVHVHLLLSPWL